METPLARLRDSISVSQGELVRLLVEAREDIQKRIDKRLDNPKAVLNGNAREAALGEVSDRYQQLAGELDQWMVDLAKETGDSAFAQVIQDTDSDKQVTHFSRKYAEDYINRVRPDNGHTLAGLYTQKMRDQDLGALRAAMTDSFRLASLTGMTQRSIQKDITKRLAEFTRGEGLPSFQFISADGRAWKEGNYLNMLTRTTAARVAREAYTDGLVAEGFDLATIEGGGGPCPTCAAWRGVIVSLTGKTKGFPTLADAENAGVFHPNCVCEPRYLDESELKDLVEKQKGEPLPAEPSPEAFNEYAKRIQDKGDAREFKEPEAVAPALKKDAGLDTALKDANVERSRNLPHPDLESSVLQAATKITSDKALGGGINESRIVTFKTEAGVEIKTVYKPTEGAAGFFKELGKNGFTVSHREAAAYQLAAHLGIAEVPPTIVKVVDVASSKKDVAGPNPREGSVQKFVENSTPEMNWRGRRLTKGEAEKGYIFDLLTGNRDRHEGNLMRNNSTGAPVYIDHGYTFTVRSGRNASEVMGQLFNTRSFFGQELRQRTKPDAYIKFHADTPMEGRAEIAAKLESLDVKEFAKQWKMDKNEASAFNLRRNKVVELLKSSDPEAITKFAKENEVHG